MKTIVAWRVALTCMLGLACDPEASLGGDESEPRAKDPVSDPTMAPQEVDRWIRNARVLGAFDAELTFEAKFKCFEGWSITTRTSMSAEHCMETSNGLETHTCVHEIVRTSTCKNGQFVPVVPLDEFGDPIYPNTDIGDIESSCTPIPAQAGDVCDVLGEAGVECGQPHNYCHVEGEDIFYLELACWCNDEFQFAGGGGPWYPGDLAGVELLVCLDFLDPKCPAPVPA